MFVLVFFTQLDASDSLKCEVRRSLFASHLDESVAHSVVGDGETQSILGLAHFHLLLDPFNVGKDEVLEADLPPQQLFHVNLVGVQGAEQDLYKHNRRHIEYITKCVQKKS